MEGRDPVIGCVLPVDFIHDPSIPVSPDKGDTIAYEVGFRGEISGFRIFLKTFSQEHHHPQILGGVSAVLLLRHNPPQACPQNQSSPEIPITERAKS